MRWLQISAFWRRAARRRNTIAAIPHIHYGGKVSGFGAQPGQIRLIAAGTTPPAARAPTPKSGKPAETHCRGLPMCKRNPPPLRPDLVSAEWRKSPNPPKEYPVRTQSQDSEKGAVRKNKRMGIMRTALISIILTKFRGAKKPPIILTYNLLY